MKKLPAVVSTFCAFVFFVGYVANTSKRPIHDEKGKGTSSEPASRRTGKSFEAWRESYTAAESLQTSTDLSKGVGLARERTRALSRLAESDPAKALEKMMSLEEIASLPPEVQAVSEKPFSKIGNVDLQWTTSISEDGSLKCSHRSIAIVGEQRFNISGENYREPRQPANQVILNGYLIGDHLVLEENPVKVLSSGDIALSKSFFKTDKDPDRDPVTGAPANPEVAAVIAGTVYYFESLATVENVGATFSPTKDYTPSLEDPGAALNFTWLLNDQDQSADEPLPLQVAHFRPNTLRVLFVRVVFPEDSRYPIVSEEPISQQDLENSLADASARLSNFSHRRASLDFIVTPQLYTLTTSAEEVATTDNYYKIRAEGSIAAREDYELGDYDVVAYYFPSLYSIPGNTHFYAGRASVGGTSQWIHGATSRFGLTNVIVHEFGHNFGLLHANYHDPLKRLPGDYKIEEENSLEYGDIYDQMGSSPSGPAPDPGYFSPYAMWRLAWLDPTRIFQPAEDGTFRIHRFDNPDADQNQTLALRVDMGAGWFNWVALRQSYSETAGSAYIVNEGITKEVGNLIDTSPFSRSNAYQDRQDSTLAVGSSYFDPDAGVTFTTVAAGGASPNEWIDVRIGFRPRFEIINTKATVDENGGHALIRVKRTHGNGQPSSFTYTTSPGTATPGADYYPSQGTISWAPGDGDEKSILIPIRPDSSEESTEDFTVHIQASENATVVSRKSSSNVSIVGSGKVSTNFMPAAFSTEVNVIIPLEDGGIIAGGRIAKNFAPQSLIGNIAVFRPDGSEDTTFNKGTGFEGKSEINNSIITRVQAIVRQSDGKLIVGGNFSSYDGLSCGSLIRLNVDGTADFDFLANTGTGANGPVYKIAMEESGNILIGGAFTTFNGVPVKGVVRLSANGSHSPTVFVPIFQLSEPIISSLVPLPDGKVIIAGYFSYTTESGISRGIVRLNSDGSRDTGFNAGLGTHRLSSTSSARPPSVIVPQGNGKYLVGGAFTAYNGAPAKRLMRLNADGSLDSTFIPPDIITYLDSSESYGISGIHIMPSGKIAVSGTHGSPPGKVMLLLPDGTLDPAVDFKGGVSTGAVRMTSSDREGNMLICGEFRSFGGTTVNNIVKISLGENPLQVWENISFTDSQKASGKTGPDDDFDGDGILNITEMALGTSPTSKDSADVFMASTKMFPAGDDTESGYLQATMHRSAANVGVWLVAEFSSDLKNWEPATPVPSSNPVYELIQSTSDGVSVRSKTSSSVATIRFVRFRAVLPE